MYTKSGVRAARLSSTIRELRRRGKTAATGRRFARRPVHQARLHTHAHAIAQRHHTMLNTQQVSLRLVRLALLRARLARCSGLSHPPPNLLVSRRQPLATDASAAVVVDTAPVSSASPNQPQYREHAFALTTQHRRVTVVVANAANGSASSPPPPPTPILVSTSDDPERIVIRAPVVSSGRAWTVQLGTHGPEARETSGAREDQPPPPHSPPPLEVRLPPRFCGLDVTTPAGGDVTITGSGVQEADVRIVAVDAVGASNPASMPTTTTTTTTATTTSTTTRTMPQYPTRKAFFTSSSWTRFSFRFKRRHVMEFLSDVCHRKHFFRTAVDIFLSYNY